MYMIDGQIKSRLKWTSLVTASISFGVLSYLKGSAPFDSVIVPVRLVAFAMVMAFVSLFFAIIYLPRWQSIAAIALLLIVFYWRAFTTTFWIL